ncbi:Phenylacetic acid catabolic protein [Alicyclobacillus herbarius]|uniref:Phenylacetic acid catabolic protein n=1 Tax=Alicyclobacillus herbarius TaxID=122960 RepID=UPI0003F9E85D|nr:Phenylacetic acid catabolic protein [Alicyclobacillus herbarius]
MDKTVLIEVLQFLADSKISLGDQLVEEGVSAPELTSALSAVAMAQAELGHARHLYNWSASLSNQEVEIPQEATTGLQAMRENRNWIDLMVSVFMVNTTARLILQALRDRDVPEVLAKTGKMLREVEEHITFASEWCKRFALETGAIPRLFRESVQRQGQEALDWLAGVDQRGFGGSSLELASACQKEMDLLCVTPVAEQV